MNSFSNPVNGTLIDPTDADSLFDDFDTGLTFNNSNPLILIGSSSGVTKVEATAVASGTITIPAATDTLVGKATTDELTNKTLTAAVGKGTWTASGTWTLPAVTLGGAITYGGVTLNNAVTGTGNMVLSTSPVLTTPQLGTPSSGNLVNATGYLVANLGGLGTGVATALAVNVGTAGAPVVNGGALGSPSSAGTIPAHTLGGAISGGGNQINNVVIGASTPLAGTFTALLGDTVTSNGYTASKVFTILSGTSGTVSATDSAIVFNPSNTFTATLPAAASYAGRWLFVKTVAAFAINSASSNVTPLAGGGAGTAILTGTAGKWAIMQSDGSSWVIMAGN